MERVQRLYDCITEVSDEYIQEAERFKIRQGKTLAYTLKYFGSFAAAMVVVVGVGLALTQLGGSGGAASSAPAASMPACSAPAASAPETENVQDGEPGQSAGAGEFFGDQVLRGGAEIYLADGEHYVVLTQEEAVQLGLPEDLEEAIAGEAVCWLIWEDGRFLQTEEETGIALYPCATNLFIVSDGVQYLAAAVRALP